MEIYRAGECMFVLIEPARAFRSTGLPA